MWSKASTGRMDPIKKNNDAPGPGEYYDEHADYARHAYTGDWTIHKEGYIKYGMKRGFSFGTADRFNNKKKAEVYYEEDYNGVVGQQRRKIRLVNDNSGNGVPGPGSYHVRTAWLSSCRNKQAPKYSIGKANRFKQLKNDAPGPDHYNIGQSFYNLSRYRKHKGFTFGKAYRVRKRHVENSIPGVGRYNIKRWPFKKS